MNIKVKEVKMRYIINPVVKDYGYIFLCTPEDDCWSPYYYFLGRISKKEIESNLTDLNLSPKKKI